MRRQLTTLALAAALSTCFVSSAGADESPAMTPGPEPKIQWFGTWKAAKAEAARTGRPILLTSAAPQCKGAPGIW